jgi:hypothetical protein
VTTLPATSMLAESGRYADGQKRTVFYSWQSEISAKICRNFIEDALKDAATRLRGDPAVEELPDVLIDQGRQHVWRAEHGRADHVVP